MTEECSVVKTLGNGVFIELVRKPQCDGCKACAFNKRNSIKMFAKSEIECDVGDKVIVEMPQKKIVGSWIALFVIPIVFISVAILVTMRFEWYIQVSALCGALLSGIAVIVLTDRLIKRNSMYVPRVISVVRENNTHEGDAQ